MRREDLIIRQSFIISHNNGDIWTINLDASDSFENVVENKFLNDVKEIKRPSTPSILAINVNETTITANIAAIIIEGVVDAGNSVRKVTFGGLKKEYMPIMKQAINSRRIDFTYRFLNDFI